MNNQPKVKRLFWDIETSPNLVLAFQAGYNQTINHDAIVAERKIICIGYKWEGKPVRVIRWDENQDDKSLIVQFLAIASQADELVAHYGDGFDMPFFKARCLIHHLEPTPLFKTVDTKAWASKNFYFNSNKLDYLAKVLGHGGKQKMEFSDWRDIVMKKCKKALNKMCTYCGVDVIRLEEVYHDLAPYVMPKTHAGVFAGGEKWSCPRDGSKNVKLNKKRITSNGTAQYTMQCQECGGYFTISESAYKAYLESKKLPSLRSPSKKGNR